MQVRRFSSDLKTKIQENHERALKRLYCDAVYIEPLGTTVHCTKA